MDSEFARVDEVLSPVCFYSRPWVLAGCMGCNSELEITLLGDVHFLKLFSVPFPMQTRLVGMCEFACLTRTDPRRLMPRCCREDDVVGRGAAGQEHEV